MSIEYEGCALGKQHREEFCIHIERIKCEILGLVHIDVSVPMKIRYLEGAHYFIIFINDSTRYT